MSDERHGAVRVTKIRARFHALRMAIQSHDTLAIEAAWERCEPYLDYVFGKGTALGSGEAEIRDPQ